MSETVQLMTAVAETEQSDFSATSALLLEPVTDAELRRMSTGFPPVGGHMW